MSACYNNEGLAALSGTLPTIEAQDNACKIVWLAPVLIRRQQKTQRNRGGAR